MFSRCTTLNDDCSGAKAVQSWVKRQIDIHGITLSLISLSLPARHSFFFAGRCLEVLPTTASLSAEIHERGYCEDQWGDFEGNTDIKDEQIRRSVVVTGKYVTVCNQRMDVSNLWLTCLYYIYL